MKRIAVVGTGYVGLTTGACFAELGNGVVCVDIDAAKIERLRHGEVPFFEPGLGEMVARNVAAQRLSFTTDYAAAIPQAEVVFIAVATPTAAAGRADLRYVRTAARTIGAQLCGHTIIVNKSTVPIGTGAWVRTILRRTAPPAVSFAVVSNPEFLAEGSALSDFLAPDRVVLGGDDRAAAEAVAGLYLGLEAPIIITDLRTAEMIKYASNAMLATRVSFINEIADMREAPSVELAEQFLAGGATVAAYDPQATSAARAVLGKRISYHASAYAAVDGADAVVLVTEWPEFRALDLGRVKTLMRGAVFVDGRNLYEPEALRALGFHYYAVGRGYAAQPFPADAGDLYQDANGGV